MAAADALLVLAQNLQLPSGEQAKAQIIAILNAAGGNATAYIDGEPTERLLEVAGQMMGSDGAGWGSVPTAQGRALFLRLCTDPGDVADDGIPDQSADQTPRPGLLSAVGAGWFFTIRGGALFATGSVDFTNNTGSPINAPAGGLVFERNYPFTDGTTPTYTSTASVSVNPGGTVSVPIRADTIGVYGSATAAGITIVVTQSYGSAVVANNPAALNGQDREGREAFITRCLLAPDSNAPGGPQKAYLRACNTAGDGTILQLEDGTGPTVILGAQVLPDSSTGTVTGYLYGPSGAVLVEDVKTANANIEGIPTGTLTAPVGVLPDTVGLLPGYDGTSGQPNPSGIVGFASAINLSFAVTYSARIKASQVAGGATPGTYTSGGSPPQSLVNLFQSIADAQRVFFPALGPGACFTTNPGTVYTSDIQDNIAETVPALSAIVLTVPASSTTACAVGYIPVQGSAPAGTLVVVAG